MPELGLGIITKLGAGFSLGSVILLAGGEKDGLGVSGLSVSSDSSFDDLELQ